MKVTEGNGKLYRIPWPDGEEENYKQAIRKVIAAVANDPSTPEEYARLAINISVTDWHDCQPEIIAKVETELAINPMASDSICAGSDKFDVKINYFARRCKGSAEVIIGNAYLTDLRNYKAGKATADDIRSHIYVWRLREVTPTDKEEA